MRAHRLAPLAAVAAALLVACGGLLFDQSNAFPCDFTRPPGERDAVCAPGDVCGADNLCRRWSYEGPQFEGEPTLPDLSEAEAGGEVLHPRLLDETVGAVAQGVSATGDGLLEIHTTTGDAFRIAGRSPLELRTLPVEQTTALARVGQQLVYTSAVSGTSHVREANDVAAPIRALQPLPNEVRAKRIHWALRPNGAPVVALVADVGAGGPGQSDVLGLLNLSVVSNPQPHYEFLRRDVTGADGGVLRVMDLGFIPRHTVDQPLLVTRSGLFAMTPDGGAYDALGEPIDFNAEAIIRFDERGGVAAVASARAGAVPTHVLHSFAITADAQGPRAGRLWDDCLPCDKAGRIAGFWPVTDADGLPAVDVVCEDAFEERTLVRVVDAPVGGTTLERCVDEYVEEQVPLWNVASTPGRQLVQDTATQTGTVLGGLSGEVWRGQSPADAVPVYLDRVPLDVEVAQVRGQLPNGTWVDVELPLALTDAYVAADEAAIPPVEQAGRANGFRRVNLGEAAEGFFAGDTRPAALVHQAQGWLLLASGQLVKVRPYLAGTGLSLDVAVEEGPTLVNGRGDGVEQPLWGEGLVHADGGLAAMVVAADDSLYFLGARELDVDAGLGDHEVAPVLTPEPGVFIRYLALERTPLGSNGTTRMRGYLVTSRNVHRFELSGTPARWSSTPVVLSGGTPMEVWFDHPRGGLARVGYQDGTIFTLPGGFQLADSLATATLADGAPLGGGEAPRVLDFENLGGWPVALTTRGPFVAQWDVQDGKLQNRFPDGGVNRPMTWRALPWPELEPEPWLDEVAGEVTEGRLFVRAGNEVPGAEGGFERPFTLLLFLEDQVLRLGQHVRYNATPSK